MTRTQAGTGLGLGFYPDRAALGLDECRVERVFGHNVTGFSAALFEVAWEDLQATVTNVQAWMHSENCMPAPPVPTLEPCVIADGDDDTSPLTLELDAEQLREYGDDDMQIEAAVEGAAHEQDFTIYITLFWEGDVPRDYTAVPA